MKKLTRSEKKVITIEWNKEFPKLSVYKNMWLLRRLGPFVQGICLETDSGNSNYLPTFHIHNLATQQSGHISLSLRSTLKSIKNGSALHVSLKQHQDKFSENVQLFRSQLPFSLDENVKLECIWDAFCRYIGNGGYETKYPLIEYYDMLTLLIWAGKRSEADRFYCDCKNEIGSWPKEVTQHVRGRIDSFIELGDLTSNTMQVVERVESEVTNLKLQDLMVAQIIT